MYTVTKRMEVAGSHQLQLPYTSKCENLHGHNWIIEITCQAKTLNNAGMVIDFTVLKQLVSGRLDHQNLNDIFDFNPTAENIAKWICDTLNNYLEDKYFSEYHESTRCVKVSVQESEGNTAIWEENK